MCLKNNRGFTLIVDSPVGWPAGETSTVINNMGLDECEYIIDTILGSNIPIRSFDGGSNDNLCRYLYAGENLSPSDPVERFFTYNVVTGEISGVIVDAFPMT